MADQTYQALIVPRSSLPGMPAGVSAYSVSSALRTTSSVRHGAPRARYTHGAPRLGSLPSQAYGALCPALSCVKKVSRRRRAARRPPIAAVRSPRSCGTIQVYCAALPSWKPRCPFELTGVARNAPAASRAEIEPVAVSNTFCQFIERRRKVRAGRIAPCSAAKRAMEKSSSAYSSVSEEPFGTGAAELVRSSST